MTDIDPEKPLDIIDLDRQALDIHFARLVTGAQVSDKRVIPSYARELEFAKGTKANDLLELQLRLTLDSPKVIGVDTEFAGWGTYTVTDPDDQTLELTGWVPYYLHTGSNLHRARPYMLSVAWRNDASELVQMVFDTDFEQVTKTLCQVCKAGAMLSFHNAEVDVNVLTNVYPAFIDEARFCDTAHLARWYFPSLTSHDLGSVYNSIAPNNLAKLLDYGDIMDADVGATYQVVSKTTKSYCLTCEAFGCRKRSHPKEPRQDPSKLINRTHRVKRQITPDELRLYPEFYEMMLYYNRHDAVMTLMIFEAIKVKERNVLAAPPPAVALWPREAQFDHLNATNAGLIKLIHNGVPVNVELAKAKIAQAEADAIPYAEKLEAVSAINWRSPPQVTGWLQAMGIGASPVCGKGATKDGDYPTDEVALKWMAANYPEWAETFHNIIQFKQRLNAKAKLESYIEQVVSPSIKSSPAERSSSGSPASGSSSGFRFPRFHCRLGAGTITGRLALSKPQANAIPSKAEKDPYRIREVIEADEGNVILVADYSQLEVVIMSHIMVALFGKAGLEFAKAVAPDAPDLHTVNAHKVFGGIMGMKHPDGRTVRDILPVKAVWKEDPFLDSLRDAVKTVYYGYSYGKEAYGFASMTNPETGKPLGKEAAEALVSGFEKAMPAFKLWKDYATAAMTRGSTGYTGYTWSPGGRIQDMRSLISQGPWGLKAAIRKTQNFPMQAGAADVVNAALAAIAVSPVMASLEAKLILQVHDEIVMEVPEVNAEAAKAELCNLMINTTKLLVPLAVSANYGKNYYEAK